MFMWCMFVYLGANNKMSVIHGNAFDISLFTVLFLVSTDREKFKTNIQRHLCDLKEVLEPEEFGDILLSKSCISRRQRV